MSLETSSLVNTLVSAGPDANKNLYVVTLKKKNNATIEIKSPRVTNVTLPLDASNSINIDYQNIKIPIISPNTNLQRSLKLTVRESAVLDVYNFVKKSDNKTMVIDSSGEFRLETRSDANFLETITVTYYKPEGKTLKEVISWVFNDCYLLDMGNTFTLSYDSAGTPLSYPLNFIFKSCSTTYY